MSNKKQTAVEWLISELKDNGFGELYLANDIIENAKQIEKEQIENAWCDGNDSEPKETPEYYAEIFYTETYEQ